jgi:thiamine-phosphate pyrophosphorylase
VLVVSRLSNSRGEAILCYVTDRRILPLENPGDASEALLPKIGAVAAAGIDWIQIRDKDLSGKDATDLTNKALQRAAKAAARATPARILVNDRLDVALSERAGGVHLGEKSLPVVEARRLTVSRVPGQDFLIGVSCHSLEAAKAAEKDGADYIFYGPVFATPSKVAYGTPQGLDRLAEVCHSVSLPVLAIGGVTPENAASCLAAGAKGIAAIRLFQDAQDLEVLVRFLRKLSV